MIREGAMRNEGPSGAGELHSAWAQEGGVETVFRPEPLSYVEKTTVFCR